MFHFSTPNACRDPDPNVINDPKALVFLVHVTWRAHHRSWRSTSGLIFFAGLFRTQPCRSRLAATTGCRAIRPRAQPGSVSLRALPHFRKPMLSLWGALRILDRVPRALRWTYGKFKTTWTTRHLSTASSANVTCVHPAV